MLLALHTDKAKHLDRLWAHRDFDELRKEGCSKNGRGAWEFWSTRTKQDSETGDLVQEPILIWSSTNRP
jgi:hypothetical protein